MPSARRIVVYRPDTEEERLLKALATKHGLPMSRVIGMSIRQMAERENIPSMPATNEKSTGAAK